MRFRDLNAEAGSSGTLFDWTWHILAACKLPSHTRRIRKVYRIVFLIPNYASYAAILHFKSFPRQLTIHFAAFYSFKTLTYQTEPQERWEESEIQPWWRPCREDQTGMTRYQCASVICKNGRPRSVSDWHRENKGHHESRWNAKTLFFLLSQEENETLTITFSSSAFAV